jgi:ubiquinone/menaquinone biosynthesis C-methylase UbiE
MASTNHSKVAKFWDKHARKYAESKISDEAEYENGLKVTQTFLTPQQNVLEMGCGTGTTALTLAPSVQHLTGTDISPEMIAICNEKKAAGEIQNVDFRVAATTGSDLPNEQFDAVLAFSVLHLVDNLESTLAETSRLLKPGGAFVSKTPCLNETLLFSLLRGPLFFAEKLGLAPDVTFLKADELDQRVRLAGFELVHTYTTEKSPKRRFIATRKKA